MRHKQFNFLNFLLIVATLVFALNPSSLQAKSKISGGILVISSPPGTHEPYVLLVRSKNTHRWGNFGGGAHRHEGFAKAACRELKEESLGFYTKSARHLRYVERPAGRSIRIFARNGHQFELFIIRSRFVSQDAMKGTYRQLKKRGAHPRYLENDGFCWVRLADLEHAIRHHHKHVRSIDEHRRPVNLHMSRSFRKTLSQYIHRHGHL